MSQTVDFAAMGSRLHHKPPIALDSGNNNAPTSNTAAVVTLTADTTRRHCIAGVFFGFSGGTVVSSLTISDGGTTVFGPVPVNAGGQFNFDPPLCGGTNSAVVVTLGAPGSGVTGGLYVNAYKMS